MAATVNGAGCLVDAELYHNGFLVSVYAGSTRTGSGIAVTECEQGETLLIQTNDHSCHDVMGDHSERWSTFSVVLIATT